MSATRSSRFLLLQHYEQHYSSHSWAPSSQPPPPAESDVIVILAALLCAVICVVGLALVARCAWIRRSLSGRSAATTPAPATASVSITPPPNKGVKKKVLRSLPKLSFDQAFPPPGQPSSAPAMAKLSAECPICLAEFVGGDEIRVLPNCGHGFHVACVDTWLGSHSSCPSCRQILLVHSNRRCRKCGASSAEPNGNERPCSSSSTSSSAAAAGVVEARAKGREDRDAGRFLP